MREGEEAEEGLPQAMEMRWIMASPAQPRDRYIPSSKRRLLSRFLSATIQT